MSPLAFLSDLKAQAPGLDIRLPQDGPAAAHPPDHACSSPDGSPSNSSSFNSQALADTWPRADLSQFQTDWRKRYQGHALAAVFPHTIEEIQAIVRCCQTHQVSLVPQGGNTGLVGGSVPDSSGTQLLLNLGKMNRILEVDADNLAITVQAGCTLQQVQEAAQAAGLMFPLRLASEGTCTIGGNLATNAGGTQVLRYGTARELCLGLQAVDAQGQVLDGLRALRKDNTGYDLRHLLIGSEGTLGIITAATLRLYPRPQAQQTALILCPDLPSAVALLSRARQALDAALTGFEAMHQASLALVFKHLPQLAAAARHFEPELSTAASRWLVLLEAADPQSESQLQASVEALIEQALNDGQALDACISVNQGQYQAMWQLREAIPMAEKSEALMVKHDIGLPTSKIPAFFEQALPALAQHFPGCRVICFGHLGDGNLHFNVQAPPHIPDQAFLAQHEHGVNAVVYELVQALNGTISAEHGIGQLKKDELGNTACPTKLTWMRTIKQALDPHGILNPGRLI